VASRLVDVFLSSHSLFPVYVAVALILLPANRTRLLEECECDFASVHMMLHQLPKDTIQNTKTNTSDDHVEEPGIKGDVVQEWIDVAISYMNKVPPQELALVAQRYRKGLLFCQGNQHFHDDSLYFFQRSLPEWSIASTAPADWALRQQGNTHDARVISENPCQSMVTNTSAIRIADGNKFTFNKKAKSCFSSSTIYQLAYIASGQRINNKRQRKRQIIKVGAYALGVFSMVMVRNMQLNYSMNGSIGFKNQISFDRLKTLVGDKRLLPRVFYDNATDSMSIASVKNILKSTGTSPELLDNGKEHDDEGQDGLLATLRLSVKEVVFESHIPSYNAGSDDSYDGENDNDEEQDGEGHDGLLEALRLSVKETFGSDTPSYDDGSDDAHDGENDNGEEQNGEGYDGLLKALRLSVKETFGSDTLSSDDAHDGETLQIPIIPNVENSMQELELPDVEKLDINNQINEQSEGLSSSKESAAGTDLGGHEYDKKPLIRVEAEKNNADMNGYVHNHLLKIEDNRKDDDNKISHDAIRNKDVNEFMGYDKKRKKEQISQTPGRKRIRNFLVQIFVSCKENLGSDADAIFM